MGPKFGSRAVIPDLAIDRPRQIARRRRQPQPLLHHRPTGGAVKLHRLGKAGSIRTDLDRKVIRPRRAHLGPARKAGLKHQTGRVAGTGLVDLDLMPRPGMVQQRRRRRYRQPVGGIRRGRHAQSRKLRRCFRRRNPRRAIINHGLPLIHDPGRPAGLGRIELPDDAGECGGRTNLPRPQPRGPGAHDMAGPQNGRGWRDGQRPAFHRHLDDQVQNLQRFVMGHMLLCLRRLDQGQRLNVRCIGHGYLRGNALTRKAKANPSKPRNPGARSPAVRRNTP